MKRIILLLSFVAVVLKVHAQQNEFMFYNMSLIPQSSYVNPAVMPNDQIFIGFPLIGGINLNAANTGFSYSTLLAKSASNGEFTSLLNSLPKKNYLNLRLHNDIISFGYRTKKMYFFLSVTEKAELQMRYPTDFLKFAWMGNGDMLGQKLSFDFGLEAIHYRQYSLLVSRQINPKLCVAMRVSKLYGMENIHTAKSDVTMFTDTNNFALTATSDVELNTSGLSRIDINQKPYSKYHLNKNNKGWSFDVGGNFKLTEMITLTGSVLSLGYIKWVDDLKTYQSKKPGASFTYDGIDLNKVFTDKNASVNSTIKGVTDSAVSQLAIVEVSKSYKTKMNSQFYVGGFIQPFKNMKSFKGSLMFSGSVSDKTVRMGASAGATITVGDWLDLGVTYSLHQRSYNNLGVAISLMPGGSNFYVLTDNIFGAIKYKDATAVNVRVGFSLIYGKYFLNDDMDGDLVPDDEDKCPRQAGKKELNGCPDKDGDNVIDSEDDCPMEFGTKAMNGCPDRDGDRIIDRYDECPDVPGENQFKGCPDRDHDGIRDSDDRCPTEAGTAELKGCPDKDGDGTGDADDLCPDVAGTKNNKGCPVDTDGDGVGDNTDKCPDVVGPKENDGCPDIDTDGDSIKDKDDKCPQTAGDKFNNGCPKLSDADLATVNEVQEKTKFNEDGSEIKTTSYEALELFANWMNNNKSVVILRGHTSNEKSESIALALSKERVEAVRTYLIAKNVNPTRISIEFLGSAKPIADNNTAEGREKNNRIEFEISFR